MKWYKGSKRPRHVLSAKDFDREDLERLFRRADYFADLMDRAKRGDKQARKDFRKLRKIGRDFFCYMLFYEPSTRTRLSFDTAAKNLGMNVAGSESARHFSSGAKGETVEDTIRNLNGFHPFPLLAMRYDQPKGAAQAAAVAGMMPILNAGDGHGEHPTQACLDLFTIFREFDRLDDLTIVIGGDSLMGRTVHSLVILASLFDNVHFILVSPPDLQLPRKYRRIIRRNGCSFTQETYPLAAMQQADIVYWTRLQRERFPEDFDPDTFAGYQKLYRIDAETMTYMAEHTIVMHPLPRNGDNPALCEIDLEVDQDPRARYFVQAHNGVPVRMALFAAIIKQQKKLWRAGLLA